MKRPRRDAWTNYFVHPADNRYHVFSFREEAQAAEFEARLREGNIAYEAHQEGDECCCQRMPFSKRPFDTTT